MDPMSGFDIRLVFTLPPRDSTLQYKNVYTSEITFLAIYPWIEPLNPRDMHTNIHIYIYMNKELYYIEDNTLPVSILFLKSADKNGYL